MKKRLNLFSSMSWMNTHHSLTHFTETKKGLITFSLFLLMAMMPLSTITAQITSAQSGDWNQTSTWVGGVVPTAGDNVVIDATHVVHPINNATLSFDNLTINGTLSAFNATFTLSGNGITNNGEIITNSTNGAPSTILDSDLTNDGVINWQATHWTTNTGAIITNNDSLNVNAFGWTNSVNVTNSGTGIVTKSNDGFWWCK